MKSKISEVIIGSLKFEKGMEAFANLLTLQPGNDPSYDVKYPRDMFSGINTFLNGGMIYKDIYTDSIKEGYKKFIEDADNVYVYNENGYIDEDTYQELQYAISLRKNIYFLREVFDKKILEDESNNIKLNLVEVNRSFCIFEFSLPSLIDNTLDPYKEFNFTKKMYKTEYNKIYHQLCIINQFKNSFTCTIYDNDRIVRKSVFCNDDLNSKGKALRYCNAREIIILNQVDSGFISNLLFKSVIMNSLTENEEIQLSISNDNYKYKLVETNKHFIYKLSCDPYNIITDTNAPAYIVRGRRFFKYKKINNDEKG